MDWNTWLSRGLAERDETAPTRCAESVSRAWEKVVAARGAYLREDWEKARSELRHALGAATCALAESNGLRVLKPCTLEISALTGSAVFGDVAEEIFIDLAPAAHTVCIREDEELEPQLQKLSHSVMASSEYVALVESYLRL